MLTSLAELATDGDADSNDDHDQALLLYREAMELFQRCLAIQELQLTLAEEHAAGFSRILPNEAEQETITPGIIDKEPDDEAWAGIVMPMTKGTLLETVLAELETLTAICGLTDSRNNGLSWIQEYYSDMIQAKLVSYADSVERQQEVAIAKARFTSSISDTGFRNGTLDLLTYERELEIAFRGVSDLERNFQGLCDQADAEIVLSTSARELRHSFPQDCLDSLSSLNNFRWKHTTQALDLYTAASKLPGAQNLPRVHLRRGDCELLRFTLGQSPDLYRLAIKSVSVLLQNAAIFYRGAAALAKNDGAADEEYEATFKEAIAISLAGRQDNIKILFQECRTSLEKVINEMKDEGLLSEEALASVRSAQI